MPSLDLTVEYAIKAAILVLGFLAAWKRKAIYRQLQAGAVYLSLIWHNLTYKDPPDDPKVN
jgi:hypothetical protein